MSSAIRLLYWTVYSARYLYCFLWNWCKYIYSEKGEKERKRDWNWKHTRLKTREKNKITQTKKPSKLKIREIFPSLGKRFSLSSSDLPGFSPNIPPLLWWLWLLCFLVFLSPLPCHWFAWARLWNCLSVGRMMGENQRGSPREQALLLVVAQCVGNGINAHLYLQGLMPPPARGCLEHSPDLVGMWY